jgi:hypothetical protein
MKLRKSLVMVTILACCPALRASDAIDDCAAIESALERLDCYDKVARRQAGEKSIEKEAEAPPVATVSPRPAAAEKALPLPTERESAITLPADPDQEQFGISLFGKRAGDPDRGQSIQSRIDSVHQNNTGRRVITLANGQVWMEREAGKRRIEDGQNVVITKHRLHYSMLLETQNRKITVQRID